MPARPGAQTWPPPTCSHSNALKTQPSALRRAASDQPQFPTSMRRPLVLPLKEHTDTRGVQFYAGASSEEHPCFHLHDPIATSRSLRATPASCFSTLHSSLPPTPLDRNRNAWIHQQLVSRHLESASQNSLLGEPPPPTNF